MDTIPYSWLFIFKTTYVVNTISGKMGHGHGSHRLGNKSKYVGQIGSGQANPKIRFWSISRQFTAIHVLNMTRTTIFNALWPTLDHLCTFPFFGLTHLK